MPSPLSTVVLCVFGLVFSNANEELSVTKGDDGIFKLTKKNFYRAAQDYENLIVYFDKPDCKQCDVHRDDVQGLAKGLENKVAVGSIDIAAEPDVAKVFQIDVVPAMRFFKKGKPSKYGGDFYAENMANWANKLLRASFQEIETEMEVYAVMENIGVSYILFYNASNSAESYHLHEFQDLANTWQWAHDVKFSLVTKPDLIEYFRDVDAWIKKTPTLLSFIKWTASGPTDKTVTDFSEYYDPLSEQLKEKYEHKDRVRGHEEKYRAKQDGKTEL